MSEYWRPFVWFSKTGLVSITKYVCLCICRCLALRFERTKMFPNWREKNLFNFSLTHIYIYIYIANE